MATNQTLFASLASILLLASCSQEEIINNEPNAPRKTIGFNVTADRATRAQTIYGSSNVPSKFVFGAWYHNSTTSQRKVYIQSDVVEKNTSSGAYFNTSGQRYWPTGDNDNLDFYAYAGSDDASFSLTDEDSNIAPTISVEIGENASDHADLLYAASYSATPSTDGKVSLNFKHAMAQIAIAAKNDNPNIRVEIEEVAIGGMASNGTFSFATSESGTHSWVIPNTDNKNLEVKSGLENTKALASTAALMGSDVFMVIPTEYNKANSFTKGIADGAYFRIKCTIYNIAKPDATDTANGGYVAGSDLKLHEGDVFIPCDFNWTMGTKYKYTINFGTGTAGVDKDGNPTLVALAIETPTVADWGEETEKEVAAE